MFGHHTSEREKEANEVMSEDSDADEESEIEDGQRPNLGVPNSFIKGAHTLRHYKLLLTLCTYVV
jgi:hypothetical protein